MVEDEAVHLQGGDKVQPMVVGGQIMLVDARGEDNGRDILQDKPPEEERRVVTEVKNPVTENSIWLYGRKTVILILTGLPHRNIREYLQARA